MKRFENLVKEIAAEVRKEMKSSIDGGFDWFCYEHDLKDCTINIECQRVSCVNGFLISDYDIWIDRENEQHESPIVINAIRQAMPEWYDVEREYQEEQKEFELEERYMMAY